MIYAQKHEAILFYVIFTGIYLAMVKELNKWDF